MIFYLFMFLAGMIPSVEELEARMRKNEISGGSSSTGNASNVNFNQPILTNNMHHQSQPTVNRMNDNAQPQQQQQEVEAFKKLLEQLNNQQGMVNKTTLPMNMIAPPGVLSVAALQQQQQQSMLQQIINRSKQEELKKIFQQQQQQQQQQLHQQQQKQQIQQRNLQQQQQQPQIRPNELLQKFPLLQQQQQQQQPNGRSDIIKRPEAQALLQGKISILKRDFYFYLFFYNFNQN